MDGCAFCSILDGTVPAHLVLSEAQVVAFLDRRPVFPGHVLVVPRQHHETLLDLPEALVAPLFGATRRVAGAVQDAMDAPGSFVGLNNTVSQSVPHVHVHVIPRRFKDGLRGFFWPRQSYSSDEQMAEIAASIGSRLTRSGSDGGPASPVAGARSGRRGGRPG